MVKNKIFINMIRIFIGIICFTLLNFSLGDLNSDFYLSARVIRTYNLFEGEYEEYRDPLIRIYRGLPSEYQSFVGDIESAHISVLIDAIDNYLNDIIAPFSEYKSGLVERVIYQNDGIKSEAVEKAINCLKSVYTEIQNLKELTDEELKQYYDEQTDDVFKSIAVAYEVMNRVPNNRGKTLKLHPEQILASYFGSGENAKIIDFKTGEGKTEVEFALSLIAVKNGLKALCITHNEPLKDQTVARLQSYYDFLNVNMGVLEGMKDQAEEILAKDVLWTEWAEPVYWYEHGLLKNFINLREQIGEYFMIIDEADAILIEQSASPCVVSESSGEKLSGREHRLFIAAAEAVKNGGITNQQEARQWAVEKYSNIFRWLTPFRNLSLQEIFIIANNALKAEGLELEKDYFIGEDGTKLTLIEHISGAPAESKQFMGGLHQAVEAKEIVEGNLKNGISKTGVVTIAYTFNDLVSKMAGFTALSATSQLWSDAFKKAWGKEVVSIPSHHSSRRSDTEILCKDESVKLQVVKDLLEEADIEGLPVALVLSDMKRLKEFLNQLKEAGVDTELLKYFTPKQVLEFKGEALEELKRLVGEEGAVTGATMVFGRGIDVSPQKPLRVIMVDYQPDYVRDQANGRTARQGAEGDTYWVFSLDEITEKLGEGFEFKSEYMTRYKEGSNPFSSWEWITGEQLHQHFDSSIEEVVARKDSEAKSFALQKLLGMQRRYADNNMAVDCMYQILHQIDSNEGFVDYVGNELRLLASDEERELLTRLKEYAESNSRINPLLEGYFTYPIFDLAQESAKLELWYSYFAGGEFNRGQKYAIIRQYIGSRILDTLIASKKYVEEILEREGF